MTSADHITTVFLRIEDPPMWIGRCSCGREVASESKDEAWAFFEREGCSASPSAGGKDSSAE